MIPNRHPFVATAQLLAGAALLFCVWRALPARYLPVDALGTALSVLLMASGLAILSGRAWGHRFAIAVAGLSALLGSVSVIALAYGVGEVAGLYGPIGQGGAIILGLVAALLLAYFVALPMLVVATLLGDRAP